MSYHQQDHECTFTAHRAWPPHLLSDHTEGRQSSEATNAAVSAAKRGIPQSPEHRAARAAGRLPKFDTGDEVLWFDEIGVVEQRLGISGAYDDGRRAIWYRVRFGSKHRDLVQEVLDKA